MSNKSYNENTFCRFCNEFISQQEARIIFIDKEELCKIFYVERDQQDTSDTEEIMSVCVNELSKINQDNLVGYYFEPSVSISSGGNIFNFYPIWLIENNNGVHEKVADTPIEIAIIACSIPINPHPAINDIVDIVGLGSSNFDHNNLQFNSLATHYNFNRAYISRHELIMISLYSEYIGITGSKVSTGNLIADDPNATQRPNFLEHSKNIDYFAYRFIGFNEVNVPVGFQPKISDNNMLTEKEVKNTKNKEILYFVKSSYKPESDQSLTKRLFTEHSIPAETWATPCPPRWNPQ